jgi:hypothetical protein
MKERASLDVFMQLKQFWECSKIKAGEPKNLTPKNKSSKNNVFYCRFNMLQY